MERRTKRTHRGFIPLKKRSLTGFTLIELVIVITILAILAAVAIPAFQDLTVRARNAGTNGALGGIRSAISVYRANAIARDDYTGLVGNVATGNVLCAGVVQAGIMMENNDVPDNPWALVAPAYTQPDDVECNATDRSVAGTVSGWRYNQTSGLFWANSSRCPAATCGANTENTF